MPVELPQEIVDKIVDEIAGVEFLHAAQILALQACSMVSSAWHHRSRKHLFQRVWFSNRSFQQWCENVRPREDGPSRHVTFIGLHYDFTVDLIHTSPSHISSFTNLQTLHINGISLLDKKDAVYLGDLGRNVRELRLRDCSVTMDWFLPFLKRFTNLEDLLLLDIWTPSSPELESLDHSELPCLKGALQIARSYRGWELFTEFICQLALFPSTFHTIAVFSHGWMPTEVNQLFAACRKTLARLEFQDYVSKEINLANFDALKELKFSSYGVGEIPPILRSISSRVFESIQLFVRERRDGHQYVPEDPESWAFVDRELCALAGRLRSAQNFGRASLEVRLVPVPTAVGSELVKVVKGFLPETQKHPYISLTS